MAKGKKERGRGDLTFDEFVKRPPELTVLTDHPLTGEEIQESFADDPFNFRYKLGPAFDILRHPGTKTPAAILISGGWGTGKTSAMKWLEGLLEKWNQSGPDGRIKVRPVWFYPWKYDNKEDVRRGLIASVILNAIDPQKATWKTTRTAFKLAAKFVGKTALDLCSSKKISIAGFEVDGKGIKRIIKNYREAAHPELPYLHPFEGALERWVKDSLGKNQRMVIFIDDLDRCMPDIALQVLEALKLYLNIPNLIFVVGVDREVVERLVIEHYSKLGLVKPQKTDKSEEKKQPESQSRKDEEKALQYLSKMFQVEVHLEPTEHQISKFLDKQLTLIPYWATGLSKTEQELFRELVLEFACRNPREVKRLLNSALMTGAGAAMMGEGSEAKMAENPKETHGSMRFSQGLQLFFVRKILQERYAMASEAGSKRGIDFFVRWSQIVCDGKKKNGKFPVAVKIPDDVGRKISQIHRESEEISKIEGVENPKLVKAFLNEAKIAKLDLQFVPEEYLKLLAMPRFSELLDLLGDNDLGQLMQIPYPPEVAEIAAIAGRTKDADIIRKAVARPLGKKPDELTDEDYRNIRFLDVSGATVSDFNPLGKLTGLTHLDLSDTSVSDLSPLAALKSLEMLKLANTQVGDIEPLRDLKKLERLNVAGTLVENIHPLADLKNLTLLGLADTKVSDLGPISNLKKMNWLDIRDTQVTDLEPVAGLSSLRSLFIAGAKISSLEHLFNLKELLVISVSTGQYKDLSFLENLPSIREFVLVGSEVHNLTGIQQGKNIESLELSDTNVTDLQPLQELPRLRTLSFTRTPVSDIESLKTLTNLEILTLCNTDLTDQQLSELKKVLPNLGVLKIS